MLSIGRVLVGDPKILILDEPSEGIQPSIVEEIGRMIRTLNRQLGIAVLLVEQNIGLVQQCADHCLIMDKGRIVDSVEPSVLLEPERARAYLAI
jgi:ABC-type branched-subunit amino acid transport system ATPase component